MLKKILVAIDFSDTSLAALERAVELADVSGAELVLVHAQELPALSAGDLPSVPGYIVAQHVGAMEHKLAKLVESTRAGGRVDAPGGTARAERSVRGVLVTGPAYQAILDAADVERVDLIVMGTHGRRGFRHLVMGSVAERLVRTARVPVLTVHLASKAWPSPTRTVGPTPAT